MQIKKSFVTIIFVFILFTCKSVLAAIPSITSHIPDTTFNGESETLSWSANGTPVTYWGLHVGSKKGSRDYYYNFNLGSSISTTVSGLPTDGSTIHIRLWYKTGGAWSHNDFTYSASSQTGSPEFIKPGIGEAINSDTVSLSWTANGKPVSRWGLHIGSKQGSRDYYYSFQLGSSTSTTVQGLPIDGRTIHMRLWYKIADNWLHNDFTYLTAQIDRSDAFRFLSRSTFGPTQSSIDNLISQGYENWLEEQFNEPATYQDPKLVEELTRYGWQNIYDSNYSRQRRILRMDTWWDTIVNGNDQLRQRIAFALSQIFVISENDQSILYRTRGLANYYDILIKHAFGNFRDLLQDVTLNPMMGNYLGMRRNEKANTDGTIQPDENYAREIMQLFTIGLNELNNNGTKKLANNKPIPTYTQNDVLNFARVFTGWNYGNVHKMRTEHRPNVYSELIPMIAFEEYHDTDAKTLLNGAVLPAGQTAEQDLNMALDNLFNHPNVGPFIGKQLIQRLVTSNPSNSYVARIANVFNDNGKGVRGDLKALVRAILLDPEAMNGHLTTPETFGKLKEPLIMISQLWRAYNAYGINGKLRHYNSMTELGQQNLNAPSVFNFYSPSFSHPGEIAARDLASPELQIFNESTAIYTHNRFKLLAFQNEIDNSLDNDVWSNNHSIKLLLNTEKLLANNPAALTQRFNDVLFGGSMSEQMKSTLTEFIEKTYYNGDGTARAKEALFIILSSPEYALQR